MAPNKNCQRVEAMEEKRPTTYIDEVRYGLNGLIDLRRC